MREKMLLGLIKHMNPCFIGNHNIAFFCLQKRMKRLRISGMKRKRLGIIRR